MEILNLKDMPMNSEPQKETTPTPVPEVSTPTVETSTPVDDTSAVVVETPAPKQKPKSSGIHLPHHVHFGHDAYTDWAVLFSSAIIVLVILIGFDVWTYYHAASDLSADSTQVASTGQTLLDANKLKTVLRTYDDKAGERAGLVSGYVTISDPSL